jgi:hypothetical protein
MRVVVLLLSALPALAQTICGPTPTYSPCEIAIELSSAEAAANPNPYVSVQIDAEFRSPRYRTFKLPAYWDGGRRFVVRVAPTDAGQWLFRLSSNLPDIDGKEGQFEATDSKAPGFLKPANVHHWALVDDIVKTPHLWMGDTLPELPFMDRGLFDKIVDARAAEKFTHIRGIVLQRPGSAAEIFTAADKPNPGAFQELDSRVLSMNRKGIVADLTLAYDGAQLTKIFPTPNDRARYARYVAARYAGLQVTWQLVDRFEDSVGSRALLKEFGTALAANDPYQHPRSTGAAQTSAPLLSDGWMNYVAYGTTDDQLGAIEHQLYATPFVNAGIREDLGGDAFRHALWNATMDGQYPTMTRSKAAPDPDSPAARQMGYWFDLMSASRHWELEPYFDVDGGRAIALEGVEYLVYVEKPGPVEVLVEQHGYDVAWFNTLTGEWTKEKKPGIKNGRYTGKPPDDTHDWVLRISREGHKQSMLRSYKFDSRETPIGMQEIEQNPQKTPFEIAQPATDPISASKPPQYAAKVTRDTRATRQMMWLWTGEVADEHQGFRVLGSGAEGTFRIPQDLATSYPAMLALRLYGMNANGKVYSLIRIYNLAR